MHADSAWALCFPRLGAKDSGSLVYMSPRQPSPCAFPHAFTLPSRTPSSHLEHLVSSYQRCLHIRPLRGPKYSRITAGISCAAAAATCNAAFRSAVRVEESNTHQHSHIFLSHPSKDQKSERVSKSSPSGRYSNVHATPAPS